ncbi:hypothetical protein [Anatilimnocola floriformis]|uniref:hypothetical protein n=1 Tax=Anatilimnocola floriformis TaxID=2948575 RepID=UPI0020C3EE1B|nr:hypothetical protein [Anatilimnocola floriformis]
MPSHADVTAIKSLTAFKQWLVEESGKSSQWFGCRDSSCSKCLLISAAPSFEQQFDYVTIQQTPLFPLQLPSLSDARNWWFDLWEGEIVSYWFAPDLRILVAAKNAIWKALPDFHLLRPKSDFVEIPLDEVRQIVGHDEIERMCNEVFFVGISTRALELAAAGRMEQFVRSMKIPQAATPANTL